MKTLEQIKNEYSVEQGFQNWKYLQVESYPHQLNEHINEVMKIYAMECLKRASENANYILDANDNVIIIKSSITNENNIIK